MKSSEELKPKFDQQTHPEITPGLSAQEKEQNYRENLLRLTGGLSKAVDAIHSLYGHSEIDTLPENVSKPVYDRLVLDIKKLNEVIEQLKKGNSNLKDRNVNE